MLPTGPGSNSDTSVLMCLKRLPSCKTEWNEKKHSERCKHCMLVEVRLSQKFSPHRRPLLGDAGWPKYNQLEMVTTFTYKPRLVEIDAHNCEISW